MKKTSRVWPIPVIEGAIRAFLMWIITDFLCSSVSKSNNMVIIVCGGAILISSIMMVYTCILRRIPLKISFSLSILSEALVFLLLLLLAPGVFPVENAAEMQETIAMYVFYFWYAYLMALVFSRLMVLLILAVRHFRSKKMMKAPVKKSSISGMATRSFKNIDVDD